MSDRIRFGVLGTARHGARTVIPAIQSASNAEVVAIASRDAARARQAADQLGIPHSHGSYEALLADPSIDAVYIPLPNHMHKDWSIRAAEAGKHVLCEKPIGLNATEAAAMAQAFKDAGLLLAEAFQWRHHPLAERMYQMLREGIIGDLKLINAGFSFMLDRSGDIRSDPAKGGGALYDVGCYPVSFARYITGAEPLRVTAQAYWGPTGVDDLLVATLEFPGDVLAHINCGFIIPLRRYAEVVGTDGSLMANRIYNPIGDSADEIQRFGSDLELAQTIGIEAVNSYKLMAEDFSAAVKGEREVLFPPSDAILNMRVIDAIYAAARNGGTVEVAR